jgi:hypothetical protein
MSVFSPAAGQIEKETLHDVVLYEHRLAASVQSDRKRNFVISNKGALSRSNLILFVRTRMSP